MDNHTEPALDATYTVPSQECPSCSSLPARVLPTVGLPKHPSPKRWAHPTVWPSSCPLDLLGSTQPGLLLQFPHCTRHGLDPWEVGEMMWGPAMLLIHCAATGECLKLSGVSPTQQDELKERTLVSVRDCFKCILASLYQQEVG